ncbi:hypothetical protein CMI37_20310 [Candidatus Pacearchaeota archaeon]|nr:hypothetical protein [Candidatus Pacearchaeota archaeon]
MAGEVLINDKPYFVRPNPATGRLATVIERQLDDFVDSFQPEGQQQQTGLKDLSSKIFGPWSGGFGRNRVPSLRANDPAEYRMFWDATIDTRWADAVLAILNEDSTETGLEVLRASASFKSNLWAIWEDDTSTDLVSRKYVGSTTTWTAGGNVLADGTTKVGLDIVAHKTHLLALMANANDHLVYRSTDGASYSAASTQPTANLLTNVVTANENSDFGLIAEIGGEAVLILWHESNGTVTFFSSTDAGDNWSDESVDIATTDGVKGVAVMAGIDNADKLYVMLAEGLWEVDTSPATWTTRLIDPLPRHTDNGRRMTVHNGALWYGIGVDDDSPAPVKRLVNQDGVRRIEQGWGLNVGDGVPSDMLGPIKWMKSVNDFLFVSVGGGAASRQARILCHTVDPTTDEAGWHFMYQHDTANLLIDWIDVSPDDDGTQRLHFGVRTTTSTTDTQFLAKPLSSPRSGVSIKRQATGIIDLPEIDGGMPGIKATWARVSVGAVDLSATKSNEYMLAQHGLEGAARTTTTLGNLVSGTKFVDYASGAGEAGVSDAVRLSLFRDTGAGDDTDSPSLQSCEMDYLKVPDTREALIFTIDLDKTARDRSPKRPRPELVLADLKTARDLKTFPPLKYGDAPTMHGKIRRVNAFYELRDGSHQAIAVAPDRLIERGGFAEVEFHEIISLVEYLYGAARYGAAYYA